MVSKKLFRNGQWIATQYTSGWVYFRLQGLKRRAKAAQARFKSLRNGQVLELRLEPKNKYDKNATRVYFGKFWVGYVPRELVPEVAAELRQNVRYVCQVVKADINRPCLRLRKHPVQVSQDHVWANQTRPVEDFELENRKQIIQNQMSLF